MIRRIITVILPVILLAVGQSAYADQRDWRVVAICDAEARQARVEIVNCDGNASDQTGCAPIAASVSDNVRIVKTGIEASQSLLTPIAVKPDHAGVLTNHPVEFGCAMPHSKPSKNGGASRHPKVLFRIERIPSNWNYQGRCGAAPWQVVVSVQMDTMVLDLEKPVERVVMIGNCGWGDPHPIARLIVNTDTYELTTVPYDQEDDALGLSKRDE